MFGTIRDNFSLSLNTLHFNHAAYGSVPLSVQQAATEVRQLMAENPAGFFPKHFRQLMKTSRYALESLFDAPEASFVYHVDATAAINMVAKSLPLEPGDEVLTTDLEYGSCIKAWHAVCADKQANYKTARIKLGEKLSQKEIIEAICDCITDKTKVLFISHIASSSALILPVKELCNRARERGILTVIDGAHVPGMISLSIRDLDPDFYIGNCHKWLCAPISSAFLYIKPEHRNFMKPLVVGFGSGRIDATGDELIDSTDYPGTLDPAPFAAVPSAIAFYKDPEWRTACEQAGNRALELKERLQGAGFAPLYPTDSEFSAQMFTVGIPSIDPSTQLLPMLRERHKLEVHCPSINDSLTVRFSIQGYNSLDEIEAAFDALTNTVTELSKA